MVTSNGVVNKPSNYSVSETLARFLQVLREKNLALFAVIDHSGEAEKIGLQLRPTKLVIFGNPKAGTPLMQSSPLTAIDLPLKVFIWQDEQGKVWLSYNSPEYLQQRHGFPTELIGNVSAVATLATTVGQ